MRSFAPLFPSYWEITPMQLVKAYNVRIKSKICQWSIENETDFNSPQNEKNHTIS